MERAQENRRLSAASAFAALALAACPPPASRDEQPRPRVVVDASPPPTAMQSASAAPGAAPDPSAKPSASANDARVTDSTAEAAALEALKGTEPIVPLAVAGYGDAVVSLPLGARTPRPIVLALHGNYDRPEWQCAVWRGIVGNDAFVLCPRGVPRRDVPASEDRWEWSSLAKTRAELLAAISAMRQRYGEHVMTGAVVFTGFSLGAILGARLVRDPELRVASAVLIEGGYKNWALGSAREASSNLRYILFACGQTECRNQAKALVPVFARAGIPADWVGDVKAGHTYDGPVAAAIAEKWPEVLAAATKAR